MYSEKTHMALSVRRTKGTYGDFGTLATKLSEQARLVNELTTNRAEYEAESNKRIGEAFNRIRDAAIADRARDEASEKIDKGGDLSGEDFCSTGLGCEDRARLVAAAIAKQTSETADRCVAFAKKFVKKTKPESKPAGAVPAAPAGSTDVWEPLATFTKSQQWAPKTPVGQWNCDWQKGWKQVVLAVRRRVALVVPDQTGWTDAKVAELQKFATDACADTSQKCVECTK
jgi:hypothetical protein